MNQIIAAVVGFAGVAAQAWTQDIYPPTAPTTLATSSVQEESIVFSWRAGFNDSYLRGPGVGLETSPGNPAACASYDIRYSTTAITTSSFYSAMQVTSGVPVPMVQGTLQSCTITSLTGNTGYYFAILAIDQAGNIGDVAATTSPVTTPPDPAAPGTVANLAVTELGTSFITIQWTAPADDAGVVGSGPVESYTIRYWDTSVAGANFSTGTPVPAPAPVDPAGPNPLQSATVVGLSDAITYGIGISASDGTSSSGVITLTATTLLDTSGGGGGTGAIGGCSAKTGSLGLLSSLLLLATLPLLRKPA